MTVDGRQRLLADLALALIAFIWGATFIVVKRALADVSPTLFLAIRFALGALLLAVVFRGRWIPPRGLRWWTVQRCALLGACLIAGYILQTIGLDRTTASKAGFITGFYIPLVPFLLMFVIRGRRLEVVRPKPVEAVGISIATIGVILMTLPDERMSVSRGDLLVLASTAAWALQIILLGRWTGKIPFETVTVIQIAAAAVFATLAFPFVDLPARFTGTGPVVFAILVCAVIATAVAFSLQSWAQQHTTPTRTALIFALEPVFAWLTAYFVAGERLTARASFGGFAILAGIVLVELKPSLFRGHPLDRVES
ncbi:MAG TPA: DMT family transporter [Bryobacteraceae bacterium]|jgi:drug/metabolite transporter (DMT)-like permease